MEKLLQIQAIFPQILQKKKLLHFGGPFGMTYFERMAKPTGRQRRSCVRFSSWLRRKTKPSLTRAQAKGPKLRDPKRRAKKSNRLETRDFFSTGSPTFAASIDVRPCAHHLELKYRNPKAKWKRAWSSFAAMKNCTRL